MIEIGRPTEKKVSVSIEGKSLITVEGVAGSGRSTLIEKIVKQVKRSKSHRVFVIDAKGHPQSKELGGKYFASTAEEVSALYTIIKGEVASKKLEGTSPDKYLVVVDELGGFDLEKDIREPLAGIEGVTFIVSSHLNLGGDPDLSFNFRGMTENRELARGVCILKEKGQAPKEVEVTVSKPKKAE